MCKHHASSHANHGSQHHGDSHDHHQHHDHHHLDAPDATAASLSPKDKLILRLEHYIRHNREHAGYYRNLADEAATLAAVEAALLIEAAAEDTDRQNNNLEKALSLLKP